MKKIYNIYNSIIFIYYAKIRTMVVRRDIENLYIVGICHSNIIIGKVVTRKVAIVIKLVNINNEFIVI